MVTNMPSILVIASRIGHLIICFNDRKAVMSTFGFGGYVITEYFPININDKK